MSTRISVNGSQVLATSSILVHGVEPVEVDIALEAGKVVRVSLEFVRDDANPSTRLTIVSREKGGVERGHITLVNWDGALGTRTNEPIDLVRFDGGEVVGIMLWVFSIGGVRHITIQLSGSKK